MLGFMFHKKKYILKKLVCKFRLYDTAVDYEV